MGALLRRELTKWHFPCKSSAYDTCSAIFLNLVVAGLVGTFLVRANTPQEEERIGDELFYEAEWLADGMEVEVQVAPDGTLLGREIEEPDDDEDDD